MCIRNPKSVKPKTKQVELVCVCELEHINTIYLHTRSKLNIKPSLLVDPYLQDARSKHDLTSLTPTEC